MARDQKFIGKGCEWKFGGVLEVFQGLVVLKLELVFRASFKVPPETSFLVFSKTSFLVSSKLLSKFFFDTIPNIPHYLHISHHSNLSSLLQSPQ
jgi:hypothetical protein